MRSVRRRISACIALLWSGSIVAADPAPWVEVDPAAAGMIDGAGRLLSTQGEVLTDRSGEALVPSCALGEFSPTGPFKFFTQAGDRAKLLVVHDGGGACWEGNTCATVLSPIPGGSLFDPLINETAALLPQAGGVFDDTNPANPFRGWTKVFIPYCTGDIGWGNRVTTYETPLGPLTIHHRGYANVRTAMRWVEDHYAGSAPPAKVMVTGLSAGGYAAPAVVLPEVRALFPAIGTRTYMVADSANGIVTDDFLLQARASWGYGETLPDYLVSVLDGGASGLPVRLYGALAARFPSTRLGQFQNAYDMEESTFYNVMVNINEPDKWLDPQHLVPNAAVWSLRARLAVAAAALMPNYRFYTAAGSEHTIMLTTPPESEYPFCSDDFFTENTAGGLLYRRWVNDMVSANTLAGAVNWRNAGCFPNCVAPPREGCGF